MITKNRKWFTLIELIVVISILGILWTIAFISLQGFSKNTRDATRISDLDSIKKVLSLYQLKENQFPIPTNWIDITFSWWTVWTQWIFWDKTRKVLWNQWQISTIPKDPLTWNEYTYSLLNTQNEYELAAVLEWTSLSILPPTYAWSSIWYSYIKWNYNKIMAKVNTWAIDYVLALPTIINWDMSILDSLEIINNNKLAYNWSSNLPSSYSGSIFNMVWESDNYSLVNSWNIILFSWSLDDLMIDNTQQVLLLEKVKEIYLWTYVIWKNNIITNISKLTINTTFPTNNDKYIASTTIKYALKLDWLKIVWNPWIQFSINFIQANNEIYTCTACD